MVNWIVRRHNLVVPDLYQPSGVYWFVARISWRAMLAFCIAFWPSMPGFIAVFALDPVAEGWTRIYQLTYWVGLAISGVAYYLICKAFSMPRARDNLLIYEEDIPDDVIEGDEPPVEKTASETSRGEEAFASPV
ncbi:hypothetical protein QBC34DRAFT_381042 [Podospora aff. communis PSN243]|uniref:Uncharacterized protein n=1 Tax=Podospora aff. communis PSN243 TaxID=3040156 RepID=A0AAV9GLJ8_9PEZI|nr:hypothetical protein QBC34DRAFT_381042 [Podospora aff. communis PSN243]